MDILFIRDNILSFLLTFLSIKILLPFLNKYLIDKPNSRGLHYKPKATGAGIIFSSISSLFFIFQNFYLPLISFPISIIGLIDDYKSLSALKRYLAQLITVSIIFCISPLFFSILNLNILAIFLISIILLIFLTGIINFINFMDGMDGLVASSMIIYLISISIFSNSSYSILISSLIGFLYFNWPPAKLFMGDSGSTYLGGIIVTVICNSSNFKELIISVLVISPLIIDAIICVIRRFLIKDNIFSPHKKHLYQRLHIGGWSHKKVTIRYLFASLLILLGLILKGPISGFLSMPLVIIYGFHLDRKFAYKFN